MEHRAVRELAPRPIQAVAGIVLGVALFSGVFGLLHLIGVARWQGFARTSMALAMLAVSILAAVGEELAFRGALFRIVEERSGTTSALVTSAAVFGLLHALNPGATVVSTAAIALEAGILLGAGLRADAKSLVSDRPALRLEFHRGRDLRSVGLRRTRRQGNLLGRARRPPTAHRGQVRPRGIRHRDCRLPGGRCRVARPDRSQGPLDVMRVRAAADRPGIPMRTVKPYSDACERNREPHTRRAATALCRSPPCPRDRQRHRSARGAFRRSAAAPRMADIGARAQSRRVCGCGSRNPSCRICRRRSRSM